jgi:hypothetical protein
VVVRGHKVPLPHKVLPPLRVPPALPELLVRPARKAPLEPRVHRGPTGATGATGPGSARASWNRIRLRSYPLDEQGSAAPAGFTKIGTTDFQYRDLSGKNQKVTLDVYQKN